MKIFDFKNLKKERDYLEFLINELYKPEPSYELAVAAGIKKITNTDSTITYSGEAFIQMVNGSLWSARANAPSRVGLVGPEIKFEIISKKAISTGYKELDEEIGGGFRRGQISILHHNVEDWDTYWDNFGNGRLTHMYTWKCPKQYAEGFDKDYILLNNVEDNENLRLFCQDALIRGKNTAIIILTKIPLQINDMAHLILEQKQHKLKIIKNNFDNVTCDFRFEKYHDKTDQKTTLVTLKKL